jgi:[ribosomal protein S5]-alanine N-acetyltransferase
MTSIETPRLLMRPFEVADAEAAFEWFGDPRVMRYIPTGPDASIDRTAERVARYREHQAAHGFSKWVIVERSTGRLIGDAGLLRLELEGWVDLGFRLLPEFWGKGLATEAARAWVDGAWARFRLPELVGIAHPDNAASRRVLEKIGFLEQRRHVVMGMPAVVFTLATQRSLDPLVVEATREVDGTLLDWALSLSPRERLRACSKATAALGKFSDAASTSR